MTIRNREAASAYLHALNNMPNTKPGELARVADRMASGSDHIKTMSQDAMMEIETAIFVWLCNANGVNWRLVAS